MSWSVEVNIVKYLCSLSIHNFKKHFFYFKKVSLNFMTVLRAPYQPVSRPDGEKSPNETGKR